ncbi:hypothetical protein GCM10017620_24550 [Brevundimonas intermedia]|uniref:Addiction module antidote protein n=1 Tax=Brevundimonas intermedia TaxID=74315 RepID=A0ABQ5TBF3_9CAUL|nr:hypothetical protein [Brevundimonas intermedia]GLK49482.1 hypothetical protein GCM10017620_24550 [Brevundimonas intermedia]
MTDQAVELTPEQVLAYLATNPEALRLPSALTAAEALNSAAVQQAITVIDAALLINQDSASPAPGQRTAGEEGSRETLQRVRTALKLGQDMITLRIAKLTPVEAPADPA